MSGLVIEEDYDAPPGHARLRLLGAGAGEDARFRLLRPGAELGHLGPSGWQTEPALLTPRSVLRDGEETILLVGPEVVDQVAVDDRIRIEAPGLDFTGEDYWPDIPPSPGGVASAYVDVARPTGGGSTASPPWDQLKRGGRGDESKGTDPRDDQHDVSPPGAGGGSSGTDITHDESTDGRSTREQTPDDDTTGVGDPPPPGRPPRRGSLPLLLAGLLVALVAAGAGFFIVDPLDMLATTTPATVPSPEPEPAPEPEPTVVACDEAAFASLVADGGDLAAWQEAAAGCRDTADPSAYVAALDSCVAQGRAPCLFQMARCYDPRHADEIRCAPGGEPSIERAIDYYARAEAAELAAAADERAALCERLSSDDAEAAFLAGCD